jgi:hypothetical protein
VIRGFSLRAAARLCLVGMAGAALIACSACSSGAGGDGGDEVLTIDQALNAERGATVRVQGSLVANETTTVLASVLLESYPPQAGGATLTLQGLDLASLVGLSSTAGEPGLAQVSWSDYPLVLEGVIDDGTLEITETPKAVEATETGVKVRFSAGVPALTAGETAWWVLDVSNLAEVPMDLTFANGQKGDVTLAQDGVEKYRWGEGKVFIQSVTVSTLQPGESMAVVFNDRLEVAPGDYDVTAVVTASMGPEGSAIALPEVKTTITVRQESRGR